MSLRKPSELFERKVAEEKNSSPAKKYLNDSYQEFEGNLFKIEELGEKIEAIYTEYPKTLEVLSEKLKNRVTKTDLDKAMFTHLSVVDENFQAIKSQIKGLNKKDLKEFKDGVSLLTSIVENLVDVELPRYKNKVTGNEIKIFDKLAESEKKVAEELSQLSFFIEEKVDEFGETKEDLLKIAETYKKLHTVISDKYTEENEKIKEYSNVLEDFNTRVNDFTNDVENKISDYEDYITNQKDFLLDDINKLKKEIKSDVADIKADVVVYERHVDRIEGYIQDNKKDLADLKENVIKDITNILNGDVQTNITRLEKKINDIREKYDAIKPEEIMQDIQEGLVTIPSGTKNSDPLTPLDQNYVTTKQLQDHYRLFLNRIQQQLSTLGGGGETRLQYLDDIVGIATNASAYDGKFLSYNSSIGKFEFKSTGTSSLDIDELNVTGVSTFKDDVNITAGDKINFLPPVGSASTVSLFHQGGTLKIQGQGDSFTLLETPNAVIIRGTDTGTYSALFQPSLAATLYYSGATKFATTAEGIDVTGRTETDQLNVSGVSTFVGNAQFNDVVNVGVGLTGTAIKIFTTGLQVKNRSNNKFAFTAVPGSHTRLFFDNTNRLETTSSGVDVFGTLNVTGNVSIAGTLTYEDVTNIDSVGIITARSGIDVDSGGINVDGGGLNVTGVSTFSNGINIPTNQTIGLGDTISSTIEFNSSGVMNRLNKHGASDFTWKLEDEGGPLHMEVRSGTTNSYVQLNQNNNKKLETKDYGVEITGTTDTDQLNVSGVSTFSDDIFVGTGATVGFGTTVFFAKGSTGIRFDPEAGGVRWDHGPTHGTNQTSFGYVLDSSFDYLDDVFWILDQSSRFQIGSSGVIQLGSESGAGVWLRADSTSTRLYHSANYTSLADDIRLETSGLGVTVYGTVDATQLNVSGVSTFIGNIEVKNTSPKLLLTDTNANSDYSVHVENGTFHVRDETNSENRIRVESDGTIQFRGDVDVTGVSTFSDTVKVGTGVTALTNGNVSIGGTLELFNTTGNPNNHPSEIKLSTFSIGQHNNVGTMKIMNNNATGTLLIGAGGGGGYGGISLFNRNLNARYLQAHNEGAVDLYYDGEKRFETSEKGITVGTGVGIETNGQAQFAGIVTVTTPSASKGARNISISTEAPSGGSDGDLWFTYIA